MDIKCMNAIYFEGFACLFSLFQYNDEHQISLCGNCEVGRGMWVDGWILNSSRKDYDANSSAHIRISVVVRHVFILGSDRLPCLTENTGINGMEQTIR